MWRASPRHSIHSVPCATRSQVSTLLEPANCRCMLPCTGYPRRARAAARSATDARPRTTTAHEWSRRLTANRAVHVPLLETARRSWNGAGNVPVGTLRIGNVPGGGHRGGSTGIVVVRAAR